MADTATGERGSLDDVMLAMDVVDTLRHNKRLVERELSTEDREQALLKRLREIYTAQGIEVSDSVLEEGVKALETKRFQYTPAPAGLQTWLANLYIRRDRWAKPLLIGLALILVLALGFRFATSYWQRQQVEIVAEAPQRLAQEVDRIRQLAKDDDALSKLEKLQGRGESAIAGEDTDDIRAVETELQALRTELEQEYVLRIVSRPGEASGIYRVPDGNPSARNYYLIVEAIDAGGNAISLPVTSEEGGETKSVDTWGLRVSERDYQRVAADKQDDGIIQDREIGAKERGYLEPRYTIQTTGGTITSW